MRFLCSLVLDGWRSFIFGCHFWHFGSVILVFSVVSVLLIFDGLVFSVLLIFDGLVRFIIIRSWVWDGWKRIQAIIV
jgi:hypothetical protein